jgi:hypothetical protein
MQGFGKIMGNTKIFGCQCHSFSIFVLFNSYMYRNSIEVDEVQEQIYIQHFAWGLLVVSSQLGCIGAVLLSL